MCAIRAPRLPVYAHRRTRGTCFHVRPVMDMIQTATKLKFIYLSEKCFKQIHVSQLVLEQVSVTFQCSEILKQ